jgi:apolipoprotein N-acyltransferase
MSKVNKIGLINIAISFVCGMLLSLAFPKANLNWLAWFMLAPLIYFIYRLTWKWALLCAFAFGIGYFGSLLYWIAAFGTLPWVLLALFQTMFIVAFAASAKLLGSRLNTWGRFVLMPALWVAFEWMRSLGMLGFTWGDIGYSQYQALSVIQLASFAGVWGVSFLVVLANAALANLAASLNDARMLNDAHAQVGLMLAAVASIHFGAPILMNTYLNNEGPEIRVSVAQGNVSQNVAQSLDYTERTWAAYRALTAEAARAEADLIVWPETVVPGCLGLDPYIQRQLSALAADSHAMMLVGGWDEDSRGRAFNSAFLIGPEAGVLSKYSKVHLVPFGEFVPARRYLPFLQYYRVRPCDTSPGRGYTVMDAGSYKIGTSICFESAFPGILRQMTASGAQLLCTITDDEWFGKSAAAEQHLSKSVLRAVENRRYVVRAAATGVSCIIDPRGRVLVRRKLFDKGLITSNVWLQDGRTFYTCFGDWLVYASIVSAAGMGMVAAVRARRGA